MFKRNSKKYEICIVFFCVTICKLVIGQTGCCLHFSEHDMLLVRPENYLKNKTISLFETTQTQQSVSNHLSLQWLEMFSHLELSSHFITLHSKFLFTKVPLEVG